jgi:hypothetical protein
MKPRLNNNSHKKVGLNHHHPNLVKDLVMPQWYVEVGVVAKNK